MSCVIVVSVQRCAPINGKRCFMKKIIAAVLITVMIISLTGCSAVSFMAGMNGFVSIALDGH